MQKLFSYRFRPEPVHYRHNFAGKNFRERWPMLQWQIDEPLNKRTLGRMAGIIHYYTSHAPERVGARWKQANARMQARYPHRGSARYYNRTAFARIA